MKGRPILYVSCLVENHKVLIPNSRYMIAEARKRRIQKIFELDGHVYAFDSTTIDLCLSVFEWAKFRKHKGGIKMHTLYDVEAQIPALVHITEAKVHDSKAMPEIPYENGAHYIFDRGYNDFGNLYTINRIGAFFVVRAKTMSGSSLRHGNGGFPRTLSQTQSATSRFIKAQRITRKNSVK